MEPYYEGDGVRLFHGDCLEVTEWLAADVLVTDPPYGLDYKRGSGGWYIKQHAGIAGDSDTFARDSALGMWGSSRPAVVFGSPFIAAPAGVRQPLVWAKPPAAGVVGSTTGFRRDWEAIYLMGSWPVVPCRWSSVLTSNRANAAGPSRGHVHSKPVDLMSQLIEACPPGTVADPFAGSGSTLVAARNLGRPAIGVEIEERYCELIAKRLSQGALFAGAGQ